jgi:hypothetical protein
LPITTAGHHQDWFPSDPPDVIFKGVGGVRGVRRLADGASTRLQLDSVIQPFQHAFDQGIREARWDSVNGMASFLEVDRNWLGRLIRGDANVASMRVGDLYRCASMLRILLRIQTPSPESIERRVLHEVVQAMREQRRNGSTTGWPDLGKEDEVETIRRWARRLGYIDDGPAREETHWQQWLSHQSKQIRSTEPGSDSSFCLLKVVGLGDWLAAQPYLPLVESLLYSDLRALEKFADDRQDKQLKNAIVGFLGPLAEAQEMLYLFRSTTNRTVEEVARKQHWRKATVEVRLGRLGLTAEDYRGENAVLGRLIVRSPVLRPLFDGLLSHRERSFG